LRSFFATGVSELVVQHVTHVQSKFAINQSFAMSSSKSELPERSRIHNKCITRLEKAVMSDGDIGHLSRVDYALYRDPVTGRYHLVALKSYSTDHLETARRHMMAELAAYSKLPNQHKNIVRCFGWFENEVRFKTHMHAHLILVCAR
jgi:hypothetical protein